MRSPRRARGSSFAVATWSAFAAVVALAPRGGAEMPFFQEHPTLQFIEQRLETEATVAVPPGLDPARRVVTDLELRTAFVGVLDDFLAPPSTFADKAGDLIGEMCRYRPAQTALWLALAADALLEYSLPSAEKELGPAVSAAVLAHPREAGAVVRAVLGRVAANVQAGCLDRESAARLVGKIVLTAVQTAKGQTPALPLILDITDQALGEALAREANDLAVAALAAAVQGSAGVGDAPAADLTRLALAKYGQTKQQAAIFCTAALAGAGPAAAAAIKDTAALTLPVVFAAYTNIACDAYAAVAGAPDAAASQLSRFITVMRADYIPAAVIGAMVANPRAAGPILESGLNRDLVLHGRATTREIVEAAVLACPAAAATLAAAAVGRGDLQEGNAAAQIAEGAARGAPATVIAAALAAQLDAQQKSASVVKAALGGAIAGAVATEKQRALGPIAYAAAADPAFAGEVLDQAIVSAPPERQYCTVLGVLAARPDQAPALLERALRHAGLAAGQAGPIAAGGHLILAMQADPAGFFPATLRQLGEAAPALPEIVDAIVLGASLANPRGAPAVAAAAVAHAGVGAEMVIATAAQSEPAGLVRIEEAVASALVVKASPGGLFSHLERQIAATPEFAAEIVTGAMAAAPAQGHVTGQAAARTAPGALARMVPRLFAFSAQGGSVETWETLTGGVIRGVLAAELEPAAERAAIADAVAAAVRSVVALHRGRRTEAPETEALAAVVAATARAARGHTVAVAQVAARTARALSCPAPALAGLREALLAATPRAEAAKIEEAVAAGIAEAELQRPAANAKQLLDYAHDSLSGVPMTHIRDL